MRRFRLMAMVFIITLLAAVSGVFINQSYAADEGLDLVVLVDGSNSISEPDFELQRRYVLDILNSCITGADTRAAVIEYSTSVTDVSGLTADLGAVQGSVGVMTQSDGSTNTHLALQRASAILQASGRTAPQAVVMLSDGDASDQANAVAAGAALQSAGVNLFGVGVGSLNQSAFQQVVGPNPIFTAANFNDLSSTLGSLVGTVCDAVLDAQISVAIRPSPNTAIARNSVITYDFEITNRGRASASNVSLKWPFNPEEVVIIDAVFDRPTAWVHSINKDYIEIWTGRMESGDNVIKGTIKFRVLNTAGISSCVATPLDVLIVMDVSGSMGDAITAAQAESAEIVRRVRAESPDARIGFATYSDYPSAGDADDRAWTLVQPLTNDSDAVRASVAAVTLQFGGDNPESVLRALTAAVSDSGVGWRTGTNRVIVLVGDAPAKDPDPGPDEAFGTADDITTAAAINAVNAASARVYGVEYSSGIFGGIARATGGAVVAGGGSTSLTDQILALVQSACVSGGDGIINDRIAHKWYDGARAGHTGHSNMPHIVVADADEHRDPYMLHVEPASGPAGSEHVFSSAIFVPNEPVTLWYHRPDGTVVSMPGARASGDGTIELPFATGGLGAGTYTMVAYGEWSRFTASTGFTVE